MHKERLVVKRYRPSKHVFAGTLALVLLAGAGYLAYAAGWSAAMTGCDAARADQEQVITLARRLEDENAVLRERVVVLERTGRVERKAHGDINKALKSLQKKILDLKEELAFYQGIVASSDHGGTLTIQSFAVQRESTDNDYHYRLVLTRYAEDAKVISGYVNLYVAGEQEGEAVRLSLAALSDQPAREIRFRLKNFQMIEGRLRLPQGFAPHRVFVKVTPTDKPQEKTEKTFDWTSAMG